MTTNRTTGACEVLYACRMCGGTDLESYLDLGMHPLADAFTRTVQEPQVYYPLKVWLCRGCGLSQLGVTVDPELLYQRSYPYESSVTEAGRRHFEQMAADLVRRFGLRSSDLALDIGSNDGVTLRGFRNAGVRTVGVDPAVDQVAASIRAGFPTLNAWWGQYSARDVVLVYGQASLITATNVFAHVHDLADFMAAVDRVLAPNGVLVIEAPWFLKLVQDLEYDTIYHEHLTYLTVKTVAAFMGRRGFVLFDVERVGIHGGSIRLFVGRGKNGERHVIDGVVDNAIDEEAAAGIHEYGTLQKFARRVQAHRGALRDFLGALKADGKRLAGISAPAKGSTLINYCGLGEYLEFLTEASSRKLGRFAPGSCLPVLGDQALNDFSIDYGLILAWNFAQDIASRQTAFTSRGGQLLRPIPVPALVAA